MEKVAGEDHDHPHQRSFWFTHGNVNGVDFWSEGQADRHDQRDRAEAGRRGARPGPAPDPRTTGWRPTIGRSARTAHRHVLPHQGRPNHRLRDHDQGDERARDLRRHQGRDVRPPRRVDDGRQARRPGGKITNAEGLTDDKAWGKPSPWVDYVGPVEGKTVGIAILNHPDSFRYPTTWHVRDYGLFAANPFGWHDFGNDPTRATTRFRPASRSGSATA